MPGPRFVVVAGAPGTGKTTLCRELNRRFGWPYVEFHVFRQIHLDREWSNESVPEEAMAFENLEFAIRNYAKHGWRNLIVTDLKEHRVREVPRRFADLDHRIVTLVLRDEGELRWRLQARTGGGGRDVEAAVARNREVRARPLLPGETRIEADYLSVEILARRVVAPT